MSDTLPLSELSSEEALKMLVQQAQQDSSSLQKENESLREENTVLKTTVDTLQTEAKLLRDELALHRELASDKFMQSIISIKDDFDTITASRREAFDLMKGTYGESRARLADTESAMRRVEGRMKSQVQHLHDASYELYQQLNVLQAREAALAAKSTIERNSIATLAVDKLGSIGHPEVGVLVNVTAATLASMKGAQAEASDRFALCTRDAVRLVIEGAIATPGALGDVTWFRSRAGSAFHMIYNAGGRARLDDGDGSYADPLRYIPSIDDLFCTLRAQFTDPVSGATVAAEVGPVLPDRELVASAVEAVRRGDAEHRVEVSEQDLAALATHVGADQSVTAAQALMSSYANIGVGLGMGSSGPAAECVLHISRKRLKVSRGRRTVLKQALEDGVYVEPQMDSDVAFLLYVHGHCLTCSARTRQERDAIIAVARMFLQQNFAWAFDGWGTGGGGLLSKGDAGERQRERVYSICYSMSSMNQHMHNALGTIRRGEPQVLAYPPAPVVTTSPEVLEVAAALNQGGAVLEGRCVDYYNQLQRADAADKAADKPVAAKSLGDLVLLDALTCSFQDLVAGNAPRLSYAEFAVRATEALQVATVEFSSGKRKRGVPKFTAAELGLAEEPIAATPVPDTGEAAHAAGHGQSGKPRGRGVPKLERQNSDFSFIDIDDLAPTGVAKEGERGFGDLVQRDSDSDNDEPTAAASPRGPSAVEEREGEEVRPVIRVVIRAKEDSAIATAAHIKSALGDSLKMGGMGGPAAPGGGRRGRKTIVGRTSVVSPSAAAPAATSPAPEAPAPVAEESKRE